MPGKRQRGEGVSASLLPEQVKNRQLPVVKVLVDGRECMALVDSGCLQTLVSKAVCRWWRQKEVGMLMADGRTLKCCGYGKIKLGLKQARPMIVEVLVVDEQLLGFDLLLGIDAIKELGGSGEAHFRNPNKCAAILINETNFSMTFDQNTKAWTASWKWASSHSLTELANRVQEYTVPDHVWDAYKEELSIWQYDEWLLTYPEEKLGLPKGLIPLMAVVQEHKKVQPMLDFWELNGFVEVFTANAVVCSQRLREWWWPGANVLLMDLRKAYLQIRVDKALWPFQTVIIKGKQFCLTRQGFGLNVVPLVMKAIITEIRSQDQEIKSATSAYVDDFFIDKSRVSSVRMRQRFADYGLVCKDHEQLRNRAKVMGLQVWEENDSLRWKRGSKAPEILVRRRLGTLQALVEEYALTMDITLVKSCQNRADSLTRVPQRWLDLHKKEGELMLESCAVVMCQLSKSQVTDIHQKSGHLGVKRTLYFARIIVLTVSKELVRSVVRACEACQSIHPVPVHLEKEDLSVKKNWSRLAMDVTHYDGGHFLTLIDCGPSHFAVWRPL